METNKILLELTGLLATILFIGSYLLLQINKIEEESRVYNWMNILAAVFAVIYQVTYGAWMSAVGNVFWGMIAIVALIRVTRKNPRQAGFSIRHSKSSSRRIATRG